MDIRNPRSLRDQADRALARGREPKKLVYTYAGIGLAISLISTLADLWLEQQISGTGGLGNLGTRAIFTTAQQVLPLLVTIVTMCLDMGYLAGMMRITRGQYADHTDLKTGFGKFWPLMRLRLLQGLIFLVVGILAVQVSALIFSMTPWVQPLNDAVMALNTSDVTALDEATIMSLMDLMLPMYIIMVIVYGLALLPAMFRMRMAHFCLLDDPRGRALAAIWASSRMMRRRFFPMLKIDLSLWPYYLATAAALVVMSGNLILALLGIEVPLDPTVLYLLFSCASLAARFAVQVTLRNRVEATYLTVYEQLREKPQDSGPVVLGNIFDM